MASPFDVILNALDFVLSPLTVFPIYTTIFIISFILTAVITFVSKIFLRKSAVKEIKMKMEEVKEKLTQAQKSGDKENMNKFLNELMSINSQYMKHTFKILIASLVVVAIFFPWLEFRYAGVTAAELPFALPYIGSSLSWLYWYIIVSLMFGWVLRKLVGTDL